MKTPGTAKKKGSYLAKSKIAASHFMVARTEHYLKEETMIDNEQTREEYVIALIQGSDRCFIEGRELILNGSTLIFFSPRVSYKWIPSSISSTGFFCTFKKEFFSKMFRDNIHHLPMYRQMGKYDYRLTSEQHNQLTEIFEKMMIETVSDYTYKEELIKNYIAEIIHCALKTTDLENN